MEVRKRIGSLLFSIAILVSCTGSDPESSADSGSPDSSPAVHDVHVLPDTPDGEANLSKPKSSESAATGESAGQPAGIPTSAPTPSDRDRIAAPEDSLQADAAVVYVRAVRLGDESWTFHVTVAHPDTGWDDYADGWDVVLPDGTVVKPNTDSPFTRLLLHPHVNEQPFVRSQSGLMIPEGVTSVRVRAHDLVHGFGGPEVVVDLSRRTGSDFDVEN